MTEVEMTNAFKHFNSIKETVIIIERFVLNELHYFSVHILFGYVYGFIRSLLGS